MQIGLGIDSLAGGPDATAWQTYQLEEFLVQVAQWVVCEMSQIVSKAVYDIEQTMNQQTLDGFNNAVQGVVQQVGVLRSVRRVCGACTPARSLASPPQQQQTHHHHHRHHHRRRRLRHKLRLPQTLTRRSTLAACRGAFFLRSCARRQAAAVNKWLIKGGVCGGHWWRRSALLAHTP